MPIQSCGLVEYASQKTIFVRSENAPTEPIGAGWGSSNFSCEGFVTDLDYLVQETASPGGEFNKGCKRTASLRWTASQRCAQKSHHRDPYSDGGVVRLIILRGESI